MVDKSLSPLAVVKAFLAAMAVKDCDTGLRCVSDKSEYDNVPISKVYGPAGVHAVLEPFFASTLEYEFINLREVANGPLAFTERLDRHRLAKSWVELPVTGVWEVHDGRITLWHDYFDAATILKVWPQPALA